MLSPALTQDIKSTDKTNTITVPLNNGYCSKHLLKISIQFPCSTDNHHFR